MKPPTDAPIRANQPKKPPRPFLGSVRRDEVLTLDEFRRRLRWGHKSIARAKAAGLRVLRFGKQGFLLGADVLDFFERLGEQQDCDTRTTRRGKLAESSGTSPDASPGGQE